MFNCTQFRKVMDKSGLTKAELARLFGVSRQTLYTWRERAPHQKTLTERAEKYTAGLTAAMDRNLLPFPDSVVEPARAAKIASMARTLHQLTAPK